MTVWQRTRSQQQQQQQRTLEYVFYNTLYGINISSSTTVAERVANVGMDIEIGFLTIFEILLIIL
jgi:hypothetical protein